MKNNKPNVQEFVGTIIAYWAAGLISLELHGPMSPAPLIWLPTGIATIVVLMYGIRIVPAIAISALLIVLYQSPPTTAANIFIGIPLQVIAGPFQALIVFFLYKEKLPLPFLEDLSGLKDFTLKAVITSPIGSAVPGALALAINGFVQYEDILFATASWWAGDALGVLLVTPLLAFLFHFRFLINKRNIELICYLILVGVVSWLSFYEEANNITGDEVHIEFTLLALLIWAGLRLKPSGVASGAVIVAIFCISGTANGYGPFSGNQSGSTIYIDLYLALFTIAGLVIATTVAQQKKATLKLDHILSSSPAIIYTCEATGNYPATFISNNVEQVMGFKAEQFTDNPDFWASNIHPDDVKKVFDNLKILFENKEYSHEYRFKSNDGTYINIEDHLKLITDNNGDPVEIIGTWSDVSEKKRQSETLSKLHQAQISLLEKDRNMSRLGRHLAISGMGSSILHEINSPIQAASFHASTGLIDYQNNNASQESMSKNLMDIETSLNRVSDIQKRIRSFIGGGGKNLEAIDINFMIHEVVGFMKFHMKDKGIKINLDLGANLPPVLADMVELEQVVVNIMQNGAEAMSETMAENKELSISSTLIESDIIQISIRDQGRGISEAQQNNIFFPFVSDRTGGFGLGLSICKSIVENIDGNIKIESDGKSGSTFILTIHAIVTAG